MIKDHLVDDSAKTLIYDFGEFFKTHKKHEEIDWDLFPTWFKQVRHPNIKSDELSFYSKLFERIQQEPNKESAVSIKEQLLESEFATVVVNKGHDYIDGRLSGDKFVDSVETGLDKYYTEKEKYADVSWDNSSIIEIAEDLSYDNGLKFGLDCLDDSCGSAHGGKWVIVGAFVDTGKTTWCADQHAANYLKQIVDPANKDKWFYQRPIIWFNNEGSAKEIKMYTVQSLFGSTYERIISNPQGAEEAFIQAVGDPDLFRVVPCQGWHIKEAERLIKKMNPAVVIYDMVDNFSGFETDGTIDQRYRSLYDYIRQMATKHNHLAIGTSQCVGEANGVERIEMHMLSGSRVAKQSTADLIIMVGRSLEAGKQNSRYIYTPKNKFQTQQTLGFDRYTNTEVWFRGDIKRFDNPVNPDKTGG